jgi:hypothetical protein
MIELHLHDLNRISQPRSFFTGGAWLVGRYNVLLILKLQNPRENTVHTYLPSLKITGKRTIHRLDQGPLSVLPSSGFKADRQFGRGTGCIWCGGGSGVTRQGLLRGGRSQVRTPFTYDARMTIVAIGGRIVKAKKRSIISTARLDWCILM